MRKAIPLGCEVQLLPIEEKERKSAGGIILLENMIEDKSPFTQGVVVAKGNGDQFHDMKDLRVKDVVIFPRKGGREEWLENETGESVRYVFINIEKIVGVI